jgi:hypothetical protein
LEELDNMKLMVKAAVMSGVGALFIGSSIALSSAGIASGARIVHPDKKTSYTCSKTGLSSYCFTVSNTSSNGSALAGESNEGAGLFGEATSGLGTYGSATTGFGAAGFSSESTGVFGASSAYSGEIPAILGEGPIGVDGESSNGNYPGVYGYSTNANGLYAESGSTSGAPGIYGYGPAEGAFIQNELCCYAALEAENDDGTSGYPLFAYDTNGSGITGEFFVDGSGDGSFSGSVTADGGYKTVIISRGGEKLGASVAMTAEASMEDTGTSRLVDGEAAVRFDSAFASTIDANRGYQVFLTPDGDTRGLYVAQKYVGGFVVREVERGRSSVSFDYRIVAHPHRMSDARLPQIDLKMPSLSHLKRPARPQNKRLAGLVRH